MLEMDEAIHITFIPLRKLLNFLIIHQIEVFLLPTVTDPAHIPHISSFELVVLVRLDAVDPANHSSDYRQRVFAVLFLGLDEEAFVVYEAWVALEVKAEEGVVAA